MKTIYFFAFTALVLIFASCRKDASKPANVDNGSITQSETSFITTSTGSILYIGSTLPSLSLGAVGNFYLDVTNGMVYGPKTATDWGKGYPLKGPIGDTGPAGAAGSKIYSGTGAPDPTLANVGDYYLDKAASMLYGPKTATGWGTPLSILGLQGPQGPAGPQGPPGNANVLTTVFTITNSQWLWNSQYEFQTSPSSYTEYFTRYCDNSVPSITQNVLDDGMVLVYFTPNTSNNTNQWAPLPYEFTDGSGNFNYEIAYETNVGTVRLHYFFVQLVASATIPVLSTYTISTYSFKVIAVTGTLTAALGKNHIKLTDYQAVSRFTGVWQQDK
jgi:hypothetical protein